MFRICSAQSQLALKLLENLELLDYYFFNERALKCKPSAISQMCLFNVNACLGNENAFTDNNVVIGLSWY